MSYADALRRSPSGTSPPYHPVPTAPWSPPQEQTLSRPPSQPTYHQASTAAPWTSSQEGRLRRPPLRRTDAWRAIDRRPQDFHAILNKTLPGLSKSCTSPGLRTTDGMTSTQQNGCVVALPSLLCSLPLGPLACAAKDRIIKDFPGVAPECAFVDCQGNWRHNRCPLVPPSGTICQFCSGLADTLRIHAGRRAARAKQDRPLKRIRLEVAPAQKQKLHALRRANYALQRSQARLARRNKLLLGQLQASRKELAQLQEEDVTKKLKGLNLPPAQLLLLEECISAAKCTSKTYRQVYGMTGSCCVFF
ncbi:hypothetical protein HPB51_027708 [Rhipicephalus microplus]|uniref:Uncharacterized protein n=1 Tax=Rhipicephalus microplus TaxID=6941 RepID=A0A9J6CZK8_RHIMP|nr:hypothetical protein HPB51_027708 [Rhipicephalus microplus]